MSKSEVPFKNLAANIAKAAIYTPTGKSRQTPAVMLVPPGMIDLPKFTKPSEMTYNITGLKTTDGRNKVSLKMPNTLEYPDANIKVLVHVPPASYRTGGAAYPQVENNEMENVCVFASYYIESYPKNGAGGLNIDGGYAGTSESDQMNYHDCIVTDFKHKEWKRLKRIRGSAIGTVLAGGSVASDGTAITTEDLIDEHCYRWYLRAQMATANNSALLCTRPGSETGELLYAYPSAHVSTSQHTGSLIMTLDVYYGCAIRHPENLMILNGIQFNGFVGGHGTSVIDNANTKYKEDDHDLLPFVTVAPPWDSAALWKDPGFKAQALRYDLYPNAFFGGKSMEKRIERNNDAPVLFYRGTTRLAGGLKPRRSNNGHLGVLDHPANVGVIAGYQVYHDLAGPDDGSA